MTYTYDPTVFDAHTTPDAQAIILTPEAGLSTEQRWQSETVYLTNLLQRYGPFKRILDYGCGIGRLSRELVTKDNLIVGTDISLNMRTLSIPYMGSNNWIPVHPNYLQDIPIKYDLVLAVWVLQHVVYPAQTLKQMTDVMRPGAKLLVVNNVVRVVPVKQDGKDSLLDDQIDVREVLKSCSDLKVIYEGAFDHEAFGKQFSDLTWIRLYQKL